MSGSGTTEDRRAGGRSADDVARNTRNSRHPGDAVRVGVGIATLLVSILAIQRDRLTKFEVDLFRLVNELPDGLSYVLGPVMQLGNVVAVPAVALVALVAVRRQPRVAADVLLSGVAAWFAAKAVKSVIERPRPGGLIEDVFRIGDNEGLGFVSGHVAVSTAIVAAVSPYSPRWLRRVLWLVPLTVGLGRMYYGAHLPLDLVGGAALGWSLAAALHLILGAPTRVPTLDDAEQALTSAGVDVEVIEHGGPARGSFPFVARVRGETRFVKLLDPEPRDRDWLYRAARFVAFRDVRDEATAADAPAQAHREAAMCLLASTQGARVPSITAIESDGGRVWIVEEYIEGTTIDGLPADALTDDLLDSAWQQLAILRGAHIGHQDLVAGNLLVDGSGQVWVVDFAHAKSSTRGRTLDSDVAELLVTTGLLVGAERAVGAARRVLGDEVLATTLPELQPFVLTAENRSLLRRDKRLLESLRTEAVRALGDSLPTVDSSEPRVGRRLAVLGLATSAVAALVAIAGPGDVAEILSTPGYRWLGFALLCVVLSPFVGAATLISGIDRRLALGRTAGALLLTLRRATLDGRDVGRRTVVEHLRNAGVPNAESSAALQRWALVHLAMSAGGIAVLAFVATLELVDPLPSEAGAIGIALGGAVVLELVLALWTGRVRQGGAGETAPRAVRSANVGTLLLFGALEVVLGALATLAVVLAMGGGAPIASVYLVALALWAIARVAPNPGLPGVGPVLLALGLVLAGVPVATAVAATVVSQVLQVWLPVVAGMVRAGADRRG